MDWIDAKMELGTRNKRNFVPNFASFGSPLWSSWSFWELLNIQKEVRDVEGMHQASNEDNDFSSRYTRGGSKHDGLVKTRSKVILG